MLGRDTIEFRSYVDSINHICVSAFKNGLMGLAASSKDRGRGLDCYSLLSEGMGAGTRLCFYDFAGFRTPAT